MESRAANFLRRKGLRIVQRNYRSRFGEIDLIGLDANNTLIFVEVRYRARTDFGSPLDTVRATKQARIRRSATDYLRSRDLLNRVQCRFDVVGISRSATGLYELTWVRNAFH